MADELHIASFVVHADPMHVAIVARRIEAMPGACVHAQSPAGKLIVTLEAATADGITRALSDVQCSRGVLSAALVYQYADSREAMMEEIAEEDAR
jgi:nitrate reductase NapD